MEEIDALRERAKELRCLYRVHGIVSERRQPPAQAFLRVLEAIPEGWQKPDATGARVRYLGRQYVGPGFSSASPMLTAAITLGGVEVGRIDVSDSLLEVESREFLDEERELLENIAHRLGDYLEWKHTELLGERVGSANDHWRWRQRYAEALAAAIDEGRFGECDVWLGGSTSRGDSGPGSDIDLVVWCRGSDEQRRMLASWIDGWSCCLTELARQQTGYPFSDGIVSVEWLTAAPNLARRADLRALAVGQRPTSQRR